MPFNFSSLTSGLGKAASSLASGASRAASSIASAAKSPAGQNLFSGIKQVGSALAPAMAPHIGQMIGNKIGGTAGNMISQMSQAYGAPQGAEQSPPMGVRDYISQGNEMGQNAIQQAQEMAGDALTGAINRYVNPQFQGMNAGNAGNMFGGMATDFLSRYLPQAQQGQPGLADIFGQMAGNFVNQGVQRYVPQQYHDINIGDMGHYAAQQGANLANRGLSYGTQFANNQADRYGFASGGSVRPSLTLRDFSEMIPTHPAGYLGY